MAIVAIACRREIKVKCMFCKEEHIIEAPVGGYDAWRNGKPIQDALPTLSADDRELLISGICGKCYDKVFPEE